MKRWWKRRHVIVAPAVEPVSAFEARTVPLPSAFTGKDTTLAEQRLMAREVAEYGQTPVERGLAISLLAVLDLFEREVTS